MSAALREDVGAEVPVPIGGVPVRDPGTKVIGVFGDSVAWTLMSLIDFGSAGRVKLMHNHAPVQKL